MATLDQLRSLFPDAQSDSDVIKRAAEEFGIEPAEIASEIGFKINDAGFTTSIKRGIGQVESALGSTARDLGLDRAGRALESYGEDVAFRNPAAVNTVGEALSSPWQTTKEALGELVPQVGLSGATALGGRAIGGLAGAALGPAGVVAGQTIGGAAGAYIGNLAQEYGGIRAEQRESGREDKARALATGGAAAALDTAFGAERLVNKVGNKGLDFLSRGAGEKLAPHVLKQTGLGIAGEAGTEAAQTALERTGAFKELTGEDALNEYGMAAIKGGIGGGAIRGGMSLFAGQRAAETPSATEGNDVAQAFTQKDTVQPPVTTQQFQAPVAPAPEMREQITEDGEIIRVPSNAGWQTPAVAGGQTEVAQAQQQAQAAQQQQQAQAEQAQAAQQAAEQFGVVNPATPAVGSAFGQKVYGKNIEAVSSAIASFTSRMPPQQVQLAQAITQANALTGGQLIKFQFNANNVMSSVEKGLQAVGKVATQFQIDQAESVEEAAAILNDQSTQLKGNKLEQVNAIHQAITGQNTTGYEAAQQPKGVKDDRLQLQDNAGLREVPVSGGTTEASTGGAGGVRPTQVQPVGATSVGAGPSSVQAGQPSAGGVRPSAGDVSNVVGGEATPQVSEAPNVQATQGNDGGRESRQPEQADNAQVGKQGVRNGPRRYAEPPSYYATDLSHIKGERRIEIIKQLFAAALAPKQARKNTVPAETRAEFLRLALMEQLPHKTIAELTGVKLDTVEKQLERMGVVLVDGQFEMTDPTVAQSFVAAAVDFRSPEFPDGLGEAEVLALYTTRYEADEVEGPTLAEEIQAGEQEGKPQAKLAEELYSKDNADTQTMGTIASAGGSQGAVESTDDAFFAKVGKLQAMLDITPESDEAGRANLAKQIEAQWAQYAKKQATRAETGEVEVAPTEDEDAIQEPGAEEVPVRKRAEGRKAVGKGDAKGGKAAAEGEAKAEQEEVIKTPQEQYEALAAETNLLPPYEALDKNERNLVADQAHQGTLTLASLNTMFKGNAKFGKDVRATNPYTAAELTKEIEDFTRAAVNTRKLVVVDSVEALLKSADKDVQKIGAVLAVEGAYGVAVNHKAYLIANRIEKGRGRAKFMHEVGAHIGLENLLPKTMYDKLTAQVVTWAKKEDGSVESELALDAAERVQAANTPKEDQRAELLAYFIEEAVQAGIDPTAASKQSSALSEWFRTLWAAFKSAVRKLGFNPDAMTAQDVVDMAFGAARLEMTGTYHGTAAEFRKFNHKYMGSGEGAQAYGWGSYLAQRYGIAKGYFKADVARKATGEEAPEGSLMRVDVGVAQEDLLNWDTKLSEQPAILKKISAEMSPDLLQALETEVGDGVEDMTGDDFYRGLEFLEKKEGLVGEQFEDVADYNKRLAKMRAKQIVSTYLDEIVGVPGIKFLDAKSRTEPTKTLEVNGTQYTRDELLAMKKDTTGIGPHVATLRHVLRHGLAQVRSDLQRKTDELAARMEALDRESAERYNVPYDEAKGKADAKARAEGLYDAIELRWLDANNIKVVPLNDTRTRNLVVFNDKNIFRVGSQVAADKDRMRFGKEAAQPAGPFAKAGEWMDTVMTSPKEALTKLKLGFLTLDQLAELDKTPDQVVRAYSDVMTAMQKTSKDMVYKAAQIDQLWAKLTKKDSDSLSAVMRDATRAQFDPALSVAGKNQTEQDIMDAYRALPASAKDVYAKVKKYYEDAFKTRLAIMEESAAKLGGKELEEIRELYSKLKGPYFPLGRTGSYYAVGMSPRVAELTAKKEDQGLSSSETTELNTLRKQADQYKTSSFNTLYEAKKAAEQFKKELGESYYNETEVNIESAMSKMPNFAKLEESITAELGGETRAEVKNMLAKLMFDALPEHHALKNQMRREGIYGENEDMRQVFAQTSISQAHYISRLQFGGELNAAMLDIGKAARRDIEMRQIQNELKLRTKLSMDNTQSALTDAMVNASYFAHLGLSPAFLMTNLTQVPMITAPWLGARHGAGATKRAMAAALVDTTKLIKSTYKDGDWRSELDWNSMFPEGSNEDRMFRDLLDRNVLDITMEHDLAAVASAQKGMFDDKISQLSKGKLGSMGDVIKLINTPVRVTELANRTVTALSAYRLKMQALATAPMTDEERHKAATDYAARAVSETQLNYSELNAPRHMRQVFGSKPLAKMIFQFRKYQQGMLYLLAKNISDALPNSKATKEDRRIARRTIAGLYMTTGLMAGTTGMPLMGTVGVAGIANLIASAFGDDDEPWDFEVEYRNFLTDWLGKDMALLVAKGLPAYLGADLSKRVGMGDIANPIPFVQRGQTGQSTVANVIYAAGGAPIGMVGTMYDGIVAMANGDVMKGMEKVVPVKAVKDALRTYRYADEGMTDKRGNVILAPEKFDTWDLALRGMGFAPTKESEYYAANAAMQAAKTAATDVRNRLLREYSEAKLKGESTESVDAKIVEFNDRHPEKGIKIDFSTKLKSVQARRKMAAERTESGVRIGKYEKPFASEARFATEE